MSELERTVTAGAAERVIRSYVGNKSERAALAALSRLLMDSDPLAIPVRLRLLSQLNIVVVHSLPQKGEESRAPVNLPSWLMNCHFVLSASACQGHLKGLTLLYSVPRLFLHAHHTIT
jgi:hypothetical protein